MGLRCLYTSIFIETSSLERLPTKAKENLFLHGMRLSPAGHQPSISWSQGYYYYYYYYHYYYHYHYHCYVLRKLMGQAVKFFSPRCHIMPKCTHVQWKTVQWPSHLCEIWSYSVSTTSYTQLCWLDMVKCWCLAPA